ncbi:hypothetical protein COY31_02330 [Candidatus Wolfebacteria bacterium CG_4_10_14_0_2_um_filter_39_18]|uniref:DUF5667 domain-containing protein n=1 Tax=Candidatus Wolfebacteria bacterium CG_4_10_14_0_2_um_filter_39_18 TaxID=1975061 RepID=A0A2M7TFG1_9BACT|nr:MAG: hypothetical protein COY31_02330 [Candidatus Wolfebacteria bacterium CG_4_10_14_0_2_um_filter_39_18]
MFSNIYSKIPKRIKMLILFIIIISAAFLAFQFWFADAKKVPSDFLQARQQASLIASEIVAISGQSTNNLSQISQLDKEGKYTEALILVSQELERNKEARDKAIKLSVQLETMAKNLSAISPVSAGQTALEAITSETSLISKLIDYNDDLTKLLEVLQSKFLGKYGGDKIPELIAKINDDVKIINELNQKFNSVMENFDNS